MYHILFELDFAEISKETAVAILSEGLTSETLDRLTLHSLAMYDRVAAVLNEEIEGLAETFCCKMGCTYCCGLRIELTPPELFLIADHLLQRMNAKDRVRFKAN